MNIFSKAAVTVRWRETAGTRPHTVGYVAEEGGGETMLLSSSSLLTSNLSKSDQLLTTLLLTTLLLTTLLLRDPRTKVVAHPEPSALNPAALKRESSVLTT